MAFGTRKSRRIIAAASACIVVGATFAAIGLSTHSLSRAIALLSFLNGALVCYICITSSMNRRTQSDILRQLESLRPAPLNSLSARLGEAESCATQQPHIHNASLIIELAAPCFLWEVGSFERGQLKRSFTNIGGLASNVTVQGPKGVQLNITPSTLPTEARGCVIATHAVEIPAPFEFTIAYTDRLGNRGKKTFKFSKTSMYLAAVAQ